MGPSTVCPSCGREAPIVYRGVVPYCTACGALRAPLAPSLNLTGKPAQVGGTVASVAGWLVLAVGLSIALGLGLLLGAVFSSAAVALGVGLPFATLSIAISVLLLRGGSSLRKSGAQAERATRDQALLEMAGHHGPVTAVDAARLLNTTVAQADAMLTELAKREPERLAIDVDEQGVVWYRLARPFAEPDRVRVGASPDEVDADAEVADADRQARR